MPTTLVLRHVPLPLTCGVFDGTIITDPSLVEEELLTTHVTVVSTAEGKVSDSISLGRDVVPPYSSSKTHGVHTKVFVAAPFRPRWFIRMEKSHSYFACVRVAVWQVCGVHKPGGSCASGEQLNECLQLCQQHAEALTHTLKAAAAQPRSGSAA